MMESGELVVRYRARRTYSRRTTEATCESPPTTTHTHTPFPSLRYVMLSDTIAFSNLSVNLRVFQHAQTCHCPQVRSGSLLITLSMGGIFPKTPTAVIIAFSS